MVQLFYGGVLAASLICALIYIFMWHRHFDVHFTMIFTLVPVACLGYFLFSVSKSLGEALFAMKIIYLGGCFLQLFIVFNLFGLCQITLNKWLRAVLFAFMTLLYLPILDIGSGTVFYRELSFAVRGGNAVLTKSYGFWHTVVYAAFFAFFAAGMAAVCYAWMKKRQVPRTVLCLLVLPYVICVLSFFIFRRLIPHIDIVPLGYLIAEIMYLIIAYRVNLYNVSDTVIDSMVKEQGIGYVSFDFKNRYLGSNETAKKLLPELADTAVDELFGYKPAQRKIRRFLDSFKADPQKNTFLYTFSGERAEDDRIYNVKVNYLYDSDRKRGYIVTFTDDTANQKYIRLLDTYNEDLRKEVEAKTQHIVEMHDNLIMSLAMMVESRDNSTGGHIKRTSEGVRILIEALTAEQKLPLTEEFCRAVIKAAPMHDLGKINVDDAVLRKPGRFTDEEYEKMKHHAEEGARVIHKILLQTDDELFKTVAENVAHYHHERWDGSGYPTGLSGEDIPLEARIMAVADVYDALVSKRVYKEAFGFEKADRIIMEGMGSQFDPALKDAYVSARPRLEEYYLGLAENE
ncbi:MAG: HD domain-containing protein [Oscillospiraceae bacterium]|nr:HD domain-containing protein [Oscillospiraceae bacterium]